MQRLGTGRLCYTILHSTKKRSPKIIKLSQGTDLVVLLQLVDERPDLLEVGAGRGRDFSVRLSALFQLVLLKTDFDDNKTTKLDGHFLWCRVVSFLVFEKNNV